MMFVTSQQDSVNVIQVSQDSIVTNVWLNIMGFLQALDVNHVTVTLLDHWMATVTLNMDSVTVYQESLDDDVTNVNQIITISHVMDANHVTVTKLDHFTVSVTSIRVNVSVVTVSWVKNVTSVKKIISTIVTREHANDVTNVTI